MVRKILWSALNQRVPMYVRTIHFFTHAAPFGPPQNVSAELVSSRELLLMWTPPERDIQNGVIRRYLINITELDTSNKWTIESTETERALALHPFYRYVFVIAAVTIDTGPYSTQLIIQMPEDGKQSVSQT